MIDYLLKLKGAESKLFFTLESPVEISNSKQKDRNLLMRIVFIIIFFFTKSLFAQNSCTLTYDILRNDKIIGVMKLQKKEEGDKTYLRLNSDVNVNFIINNSIKINELSIFQNNTLIYSESKRLVNEKEKVNKQTVLIKDNYYAENSSLSTKIKVPPINFNLLLMYFNEPNDISKVYSDSLQEMLNIEKLNHQHFNVNLPDGGNNEYFYKNGRCDKVVVHSTFFKIEMILKSLKK